MLKRNIIFSINAFIFFLFFSLPHSAYPNEANTDLEYDNGFVTVHKTNIPRVDFLFDLSEAADLHLIVVEKIDPKEHITVNFDHEPIEEVLSSVLKGYNYAAIFIFNASEKGQGSLFSFNINENKRADVDRTPVVNRSISSGPHEPLDASDRPVDAKEAAKQALTQKVEELKRRIESGESDRSYEQWAKIRGPKYVTNDRKMLEIYQKQLSEL